MGVVRGRLGVCVLAAITAIVLPREAVQAQGGTAELRLRLVTDADVPVMLL